MVVITEDTYIRKMPPSAFTKLGNMLDPGRLWEKMATIIPYELKAIDDPDAPLRYTQQQIEVFALVGQRSGPYGGSPTQKVLLEWGTKNARIRHLIQILLRAELYAAANYLHKDLLKLGLLVTSDPQTISTDGLGDVTPSKVTGDIIPSDLPGAEADSCTTDQPDESDSCNLSHVSYPSDGPGDQKGVLLSSLEKNLTVACENSDKGWIGLDDIELQTISYSILSSITNNFNSEPMENGGNLIGSGGFGKVYMGEFHNHFRIAIKCLVQSELASKEDHALLIKQFENEVKMLSTYRHENVVHLLGYSIDGPSQCLVYQYLPNGSLEDRLACLQGTPPLSANMRMKIVKGTAHGIQFLNDKGYVHRDIKSANILLDSEFTAKVGDFATVVSAPSGDSKTIAKATLVIGTPAYLAPEAISFDISTKLDSYSFGVVLLEVITGLPAQDSRREEPTLSCHIMENVEDPAEIHNYVDQSAGDWADGVVDRLYDISMHCLDHMKKKRPNVKDILAELEVP